MRLSEKWIKEIVNVDDTIENIAEKMVLCGNEYESVNVNDCDYVYVCEKCLW